ncbi:MAG TPA: erythromycin esterase family protein [Chthoniobacterales bacterium]
MATLAARAAQIADVAHRISSPAHYDRLIEAAGERRVVLIGEASHGTHEFYETRAELTKRLIAEKGFRCVAVEADWPDALRVHRYVSGDSEDADARSALGDFTRFPHWMWRNIVVLEFVEWLRTWNQGHERTQAGFYGMDLYNLHGSISDVLQYLEGVDPAAARRARDRYACFDHFGDPQMYGFAATKGIAESCEDDVVEQLMELRRRSTELLAAQEPGSAAELFYAEQNARLVANAERYYRSMFGGRASSWNLRDEHMAGTIQSLMNQLDGGGKIVAWAHNSHLGDARATEMSERGELNVGQLVRAKFGDESFLIGFSTYAGTVTAARDWDTPAERRNVRPGLTKSYEELFHATGIPRFWLNLRELDGDPRELLDHPRLQRAIGVIYRPETERWSHYFNAKVTEQFDALIHFDETRALEPLEPNAQWQSGEAAETFPTGL